MIKAVIFDMDGTLVDTERLGIKAWELTSERLGIEVPEDLVYSFIGRTQPAVLGLLAESCGGMEVARRAYDIHRVITVELAKTDLVAKPGAYEALDALADEGYYLGVASSSRLETIRGNLGRLGLLDFFEDLTSGDEVSAGKPDPEIFQLAASRAGAEPGECIVVEDSPNGVRSGHAAGTHVVMVPDVIAPTPEISAMCDAILESLVELPRAVDALGA